MRTSSYMAIPIMFSAVMTGPEMAYTVPVRGPSSSVLEGAIVAMEGIGADEAGVENDLGLPCGLSRDGRGGK